MIQGNGLPIEHYPLPIDKQKEKPFFAYQLAMLNWQGAMSDTDSEQVITTKISSRKS
ncbi:MAG: hypothetical protein HOP19_03050 [Acidobacteria bacterium]|nr:hypothetical protein [Acidobacteriota bacterium]